MSSSPPDWLNPTRRGFSAWTPLLPPCRALCSAGCPISGRAVLFPGPSTATQARRASEGHVPIPRSRFGLVSKALIPLIVLPGLLLYPCLGFRLFEPDESRYAQIPREMLQRGDLVVPTLQGEPYLDKPPLLYWAVMLSYRLFGIHDWSARLVPALAVHATILLVYLLGRRTLGERPAWWAPCARAGTGFYRHGTLAAARRPADSVDRAGAPHRVRGGSWAVVCPRLVAGLGDRLRSGRSHQGARRRSLARAASVAASSPLGAGRSARVARLGGLRRHRPGHRVAVVCGAGGTHSRICFVLLLGT